MGHVGPFFPIARELAAQGHQLHLAVRNVASVVQLYEGLEYSLYQAPTNTSRLPQRIPDPITFPQILCNVGYDNAQQLAGQVRAWGSLLNAVSPDLIIADHAPGTLIAARGRDIPLATVGNGFFCPPDKYPLPALRPFEPVDVESIQSDEDNLVERINAVLTAGGQPLIARIGELYSCVDAQFLATFSEFDHYGTRDEVKYFGVWPHDASAREDVVWPPGTGPKVFAYLKPSRGLGHLFDWLAAQGYPTIVVGDGLDIETLRRLKTPNLHFSARPLPLQVVGRECDLAVLNATHGTTCTLLLYGKPVFQLPHNLEQAVTSTRAVEYGAGAEANKDDGSNIVWEFSGFMHNERFSQRAKVFAERYQGFNPDQSVREIVDALECLLDQRHPRAAN